MPPAGKTTLQGHIAFGPDSTLAIEQALRAASDLGHDWVGTEHLLLGLIRTADSSAALMLRNLGFTSEGLHDTVAAAVTDRLRPLTGRLRARFSTAQRKSPIQGVDGSGAQVPL